MRKAFRKNWGPKILSLILATAVWMIVYKDLEANGLWEVEEPPRALPVPKDERIDTIGLQLTQLKEQLKNQINLIEQQQKVLEEEKLKEQEEPPTPPGEGAQEEDSQ